MPTTRRRFFQKKEWSAACRMLTTGVTVRRGPKIARRFTDVQRAGKHRADRHGYPRPVERLRSPGGGRQLARRHGKDRRSAGRERATDTRATPRRKERPRHGL